MRSTSLVSALSWSSRARSHQGTVRTHCRTGTSTSTWSARYAAVSFIRRPLQMGLELRSPSENGTEIPAAVVAADAGEAVRERAAPHARSRAARRSRTPADHRRRRLARGTSRGVAAGPLAWRRSHPRSRSGSCCPHRGSPVSRGACCAESRGVTKRAADGGVGLIGGHRLVARVAQSRLGWRGASRGRRGVGGRHRRARLTAQRVASRRSTSRPRASVSSAAAKLIRKWVPCWLKVEPGTRTSFSDSAASQKLRSLPHGTFGNR